MLLIPVSAGIAYELIRLAGRFDNVVTRLLSLPGMLVQKITTKEPTADMIEVAIKAVEAVFDWEEFQKEAFGYDMDDEWVQESDEYEEAEVEADEAEFEEDEAYYDEDAVEDFEQTYDAAEVFGQDMDEDDFVEEDAEALEKASEDDEKVSR